jgi:TetR/AcrR family transcriptional repressor of lmrAB and yxaGH operons
VKKGEETRGRMIATASRLFTTQGYHGAGLNQILDEARAPKGSMYFHFPGGKEELAAEAVRAAAAEWRVTVLGATGTAGSPARAVRAVCELLATRLEASGFVEGCPVATVALEAAPTSDAIHEACAEAYRTWREVIGAALRTGGASEARAERLATLVLSAVEGAMLLCKAERSGKPLRAVGAELELLLK